MSEPNIQEGQPEILTRTPPTFIHARRPESLNQVEVETEIKAMLADPGHPVNNAGDVRHELAHKRLVQLYERRERIEGGPPPPDPANEKPLVTVEGAPPGFQWDVARLNAGVRTVEKYGVGRAEVGSLLKTMVTRAQAIRSGREEMPDPEVTESTLHAEWGEHYDRKVLAARLFIQSLPPDVGTFLYDHGLADDLAFSRRAATLGERLLPLHKRKQEIMADPDYFMGYTGADPERHKALVVEWNRIHKQLVEGPDTA